MMVANKMDWTQDALKILFICTEGFDTPGPSNHLISTLIEDLTYAGCQVVLVQSRRQKERDELTDNLRGNPNLKVISVDRKIVAKESFVKRYVEECIYHFRAFRRWRRLRSIDVVFVQSCPTVVFSIGLVKLFKRWPVLYSVQDVWPGSAVKSGVLRSRFLSGFFALVQKAAYRMSDVITVISEDMKKKVIEQGVPEKRLSVIVNWFDDHTVKEIPWEENRFVKKYNLDKNKFFVQYAGTLGFVFDYEMVLAVAEQLRQQPKIEFQMIGQGSVRQKFEEEKKRRKLDNIVFYPLEPQDMVSDVYSACSICLIPLKRGIIGNSVPSKASLLMACRRVTLNSVDENSAYFRMFEQQRIGVSVSNNDPQGVVEAIIKLYEDREWREMLANNGAKFASEFYSRSVNTKKFYHLFGKLGEARR